MPGLRRHGGLRRRGGLQQVSPPPQANLPPLHAPVPSHGQVSASPGRWVLLPGGWQGLPVAGDRSRAQPRQANACPRAGTLRRVRRGPGSEGGTLALGSRFLALPRGTAFIIKSPMLLRPRLPLLRWSSERFHPFAVLTQRRICWDGSSGEREQHLGARLPGAMSAAGGMHTHGDGTGPFGLGLAEDVPAPTAQIPALPREKRRKRKSKARGSRRGKPAWSSVKRHLQL